MPRLSKTTGRKKEPTKKICINDQVLNKKKSIETSIERHYGLSRVRYLIREKIEIERLVLNAVPAVAYELKSQILEAERNHNADKFDGTPFLESFVKKVDEFLKDHPRLKQDTVESYINKHCFYMPLEFAYLMRMKGNINIQDCTIDEIEDAIYGLMGIDDFLDYLIYTECEHLKISDQMLSVEFENYSPRLHWQSTGKKFAGLISSLINNGWIKRPGSNWDTDARYYCYHFDIPTSGKRIQPRYLSKILSTIDEEVIQISADRQKKLPSTIYPFVPATTPNNS